VGPIVLERGGGETIADNRRRWVAIKAGVDAIAVTETRYEPGERGPDAHVHRRHTDAFYVLEGALAFGLGPRVEEVVVPAGSFVAAPPGVVHTFRNDGPETACYLNFHAPSERFHDELRARRDGGDPDWFDQVDPPADGGRPLSDAVVSGPGEGERIAVGGSTVVLKGTDDGTDGFLFLSETTLAPGFPGPPPHVHRELHDLFYVLDGTLELLVGDETVAAGPGTFALFRPGVRHAFSNAGGAEPVSFLNVNTPAGWEGYMRDLGAAFAGERPPSREEIGRIASRYDFEVVAPA
jgi:mannose-6-phosphate isomerase-like protein (cupin superfamily)